MMVGGEEDCAPGQQVCNGPLEPGTDYSVGYRLRTGDQFVEYQFENATFGTGTHTHTHTHAHTLMCRTLRHVNLVCMIGVSLDEPPIYLVTEFMAKGSLVDYLRSRGRAVVTKQNLLDFARDICKGMVYLESQNFVHRYCIARHFRWVKFSLSGLYNYIVFSWSYFHYTP